MLPVRRDASPLFYSHTEKTQEMEAEEKRSDSLLSTPSNVISDFQAQSNENLREVYRNQFCRVFYIVISLEIKKADTKVNLQLASKNLNDSNPIKLLLKKVENPSICSSGLDKTKFSFFEKLELLFDHSMKTPSPWYLFFEAIWFLAIKDDDNLGKILSSYDVEMVKNEKIKPLIILLYLHILILNGDYSKAIELLLKNKNEILACERVDFLNLSCFMFQFALSKELEKIRRGDRKKKDPHGSLLCNEFAFFLLVIGNAVLPYVPQKAHDLYSIKSFHYLRCPQREVIENNRMVAKAVWVEIEEKSLTPFFEDQKPAESNIFANINYAAFSIKANHVKQGLQMLCALHTPLHSFLFSIGAQEEKIKQRKGVPMGTNETPTSSIQAIYFNNVFISTLFIKESFKSDSFNQYIDLVFSLPQTTLKSDLLFNIAYICLLITNEPEKGLALLEDLDKAREECKFTKKLKSLLLIAQNGNMHELKGDSFTLSNRYIIQYDAFFLYLLARPNLSSY